MKQLLSFTLLFLFAISVASQKKEIVKTISNSYTISSKALDQDRTIDIYLPPSYHSDTKKSYPVLYVLDGQEYFLHGIAYQDMLRFRDKTPEFIVVGIQTDRQKRRVLFYAESTKFNAFLATELIPYIDTKYRTAKEKERIFFGWEMAAGLGLEILAKHKALFSGYILASPSHKNQRIKDIQQLPKEVTDQFLLVSAGKEESWIIKDSLLLSLVGAKESWRFALYDREDHYTTPLKTIHEGLSDYFSDYKPIRLRSLKAYDEYGGLDALSVYYKKRGERYGISTDIHGETKHFLIFNALSEDNIERFDFYFTKFDDFAPSISRDFWVNRYAKFYIKHHENDKALALLKLGLKKFPKSTLLLETIGDFYSANKKQSKAKRYYKKALAINPELTSVIEKLKD